MRQIVAEYNPALHGVATFTALHKPVTAPDISFREFIASMYDFMQIVFEDSSHSWLNGVMKGSSGGYDYPETFEDYFNWFSQTSSEGQFAKPVHAPAARHR